MGQFGINLGARLHTIRHYANLMTLIIELIAARMPPTRLSDSYSRSRKLFVVIATVTNTSFKFLKQDSIIYRSLFKLSFNGFS